MSQHDGVLDNATGAAFRADANSFIAAILSNNSGASSPSVTYAYMWWCDTSSGLLKQRNAANSDWVTIGTLASTNLGLMSLAGGTFTGPTYEKGFTVAAHATTCDIWSGGNFGTLTGSAVTFTDVADAPVADTWRWIRSNAAHILTNGANIQVQGNTNFTLAAGDVMLWHAITTTTFEVWIFKDDGTAVVSSGSSGTGRLIDTTYYSCPTQNLTSISNATPAVLTFSAARNLPQNGSPIRLTTSGSLPTGLSTGTTYFVSNASGTTCNLCTTKANALAGTSKIATSSAGSGTHTITNAPYAKATNNPTYVEVDAQGGGGASGGTGTSGAGAAGTAGCGAGGGFGRLKILASALSASETVTTGAGGQAALNTTGTTGGTSSFGSFISATGGTGGASFAAGAANGVGGTVTGAEFYVNGQDGINTSPYIGGSSFMGTGGIDGLTGNGFGAASGGVNGVSQTPAHASKGIVIVREYS
jgi:hypothetical protein